MSETTDAAMIAEVAQAERVGDAELLAIKPGTRADEADLHRQLVEHLHHGREWYNPTPEVLAVINEWREALGREPLAA